MKKFAAIIFGLLVFFLILPPLSHADGVYKKKKSARATKKKVAKKIVKKQPLVKKPKAVVNPGTNVTSYCLLESKQFVISVSGDPIFLQSLKLEADGKVQVFDGSGNWLAPTKYSKDLDLINDLHKALAPESTEFYSPVVGSNRILISTVVMSKNLWRQADVEKAYQVIKSHVGEKRNITFSPQCQIDESKIPQEVIEAKKDDPTKILQ